MKPDLKAIRARYEDRTCSPRHAMAAACDVGPLLAVVEQLEREVADLRVQNLFQVENVRRDAADAMRSLILGSPEVELSEWLAKHDAQVIAEVRAIGFERERKAIEDTWRRSRSAALEEAALMLENEGWDTEREVPELVRSLAPTATKSSAHELLVADEGTEGVATWVARCVCGWKSRLMVEEDADRAAAAHRASVEACAPANSPGMPDGSCKTCGGTGRLVASSPKFGGTLLVDAACPDCARGPTP